MKTSPRRYLFVTWEGGGNVPPVLDLARSLVARGHAVSVLGEPCLESRVAAIGAAFIPFRDVLTRTDANAVLLRDWDARTPPAALRHTMEVLMFGPARAIARQVDTALARTRAEVLVADWLLPGALIPGEARGMPTVALVHCIDMLPGPGKPGAGMAPARGPFGRLRDRAVAGVMNRIADGFRPTLNAARAEFGLDPLDRSFAQFARATRILVQSSAAFDFAADPAPENLRYIGPSLGDPAVGAADVVLPASAQDERPLVLASLSTTFQDQAGHLRAILDALGRVRAPDGGGVRGIVTAGPAMRGCDFSVPDNVKLHETAPHARLLPQVAAFVTHCGHGSVMRALSCGVPMVALPMGRDQGDIAARIVARGLGLRAKPRPRQIAQTLARVLTEPQFTEAALALSPIIRAEAAAGRGVAELETLAAKGRIAA